MTSMLKKPEQNDAAAERVMLTGDTYATVLLCWAVDRFGFNPETKRPYVFEWAPETILEEIKDETGVAVPKRNFDKLMAAVTIVTTDLFFKDVSRFVELANVLAGDDFQPDEFDPADVAECAWAVTESLLLDPPDDDPEPFSDDIRHYVGFVLGEEGYVTPPDILRIALNADLSAKVDDTFADDPAMFKAVYEKQQEKKKEVEVVILEGLMEMLAQLQALSLRNGDTAGVVERLKTSIRAAAGKMQR